jgi:hypothetical protein
LISENVLNEEPSTKVESNGLVDFVVETPIEVKTLAPKLPRPRDISPWADQTPTQILEREYRVDDIVYTTSSPQVNVIGCPILALTAFKNAMSTFRYLRWDFMEWRYQIMSVPQVWGAVGFTCVPLDGRRSSNNLDNDYGLLSHSDCQIADFSSANSGRIMVPWNFLNKWLDFVKFTEEVPPAFNLLTDLKIIGGPWIYSADSSIPRSVTINTWCSLHGVQVAGPRIANSLTFQREEEETAEMQASAAAGILYSAMQTELTKYLATSGVAHLRNAAQAGFHQVDEMLGDWFDFDDPTSKPDSGGETGGMSVIPDIYGNLNFSAPKCLLGVGSHVLPTKVPRHSWLEFIKTPWLEYSGTLTVSYIFDGWPFSRDETDVSSQIRPQCSRLDFASRFFRMWRGSFEYTIIFISSPMVVQKVGISLSYTDSAGNVGDIVVEVIEVKGTTIHKILVPYLYTNPYQFIQDGSVNDTAGPGERPYVRLFSYAAPKAAGDTTPVLKFLAFRNACDDFKFYSPKCPQYQKEQPEAAEMQTSLKSFAKIQPSRQFEVIENDVPFWPDQTVTMEQLCQRWSCRTLPDPDALRDLDDVPAFYWNTADCIRSVFFYNRGQFKVKATFNQPETPYTADQGLMAKMDPRSRYTNNPVPDDFNRINDGCQVISFGLTQLLEYTEPWYCNSEWISTYATNQGVVGAIPNRVNSFVYAIGNDDPDVTPTLSFCATSMGPDYALALQLPPPYYPARWYLTTEPVPPEPEPRVQTLSTKPREDVSLPPSFNKDSRGRLNAMRSPLENNLRKSKRAGH